MPVFIDSPSGSLSTGSFRVSGWAATEAGGDGVSVLVNGLAVPHALLERPSLRAIPALRGFASAFAVMADVVLGPEAAGRDVRVEIRCGLEAESRTVRWDAAAPEDAEADERRLRDEARQWVEQRLRCPSCRTDGGVMERRGAALLCHSCGAEFAQPTRALNLILPDMGLSSDVSPTENVSSNPYTHDAVALIEATVAAGGWVLDCGAGRRPRRTPHVVNLEIVDYPSTDVLGVGESLPFQTDSFDAVLSLAVLEHVRDPFACAREIMRVLKPGGVVRADVPFLQPSHGYPHHYYNMTKQGLENLFAGIGRVLECKVPLHGQPILAVQWLLSQYLLGLPPGPREEFAAMTIGQAAAIDPLPFLTSGQPVVEALSPQAREIVGCLNSILVRKD